VGRAGSAEGWGERAGQAAWRAGAAATPSAVVGLMLLVVPPGCGPWLIQQLGHVRTSNPAAVLAGQAPSSPPPRNPKQSGRPDGTKWA